MLKAETIKRYIEEGRKTNSEQEVIEKFEEIFDGSISTEYLYTAFQNGFRYKDNPLLGTEIKAYRIGKPRISKSESEYCPSYNFANQKPEHGISICSTEWFNSMKSVFFGIYDDKLKYRGVYKIKGIIIGFGGDDEPLLYLTEHPVKTKIKTTVGLKRAVAGLEKARGVFKKQA